MEGAVWDPETCTIKQSAAWRSTQQQPHILNTQKNKQVQILYYVNMLKIKGTNIYTYHRLQGNRNSSGLQCEVAYWPALAAGSSTIGGCPLLEWTDFGPAVCSSTDPPAQASCNMAFTQQCSPATTQYFSIKRLSCTNIQLKFSLVKIQTTKIDYKKCRVNITTVNRHLTIHFQFPAAPVHQHQCQVLHQKTHWLLWWWRVGQGNLQS